MSILSMKRFDRIQGRLNKLDYSLTMDSTKVSTVRTAEVTLTATEIVGTAAGDLGHASGATIVPAPGAGFVLQFLGATLIYDFDTAAYTGGGNDTFAQNGASAVALSTVIAAADLLLAAGDKIVQIAPLSASDQALTANVPLTLKSTTAWTQPGTAAGVLRVKYYYRIIATEL